MRPRNSETGNFGVAGCRLGKRASTTHVKLFDIGRSIVIQSIRQEEVSIGDRFEVGRERVRVQASRLGVEEERVGVCHRLQGLRGKRVDARRPIRDTAIATAILAWTLMRVAMPERCHQLGEKQDEGEGDKRG